MKTNFFIFLLLLFITLLSCAHENELIEAQNEYIFDKQNSPHHINKDIVIDSGYKLIVLSGTELIFYDSAKIIIKGGIHLQGTEQNKVILRPYNEENVWGGIIFQQPDDSCIVENTEIRNGLIYGEDAQVRISNSGFWNNYSLHQFDALIRLFKGSVNINHSRFQSNDTGEGILIHHTNSSPTIVEHCVFKGVSDAVEYLNVYENGVIRNNIITDVKQESGDGIDLNGCKGVRIENNLFENIRDFGIETGNDKYGPSLNILIAKNVFVNCQKAVVVKGGSNAILVNNTFFNNNYGVSCMVEVYGSNYEPNQIEVFNSIFSGSLTNDFENNENSTIIFNHCLSDKMLFIGESNLYADPLFVDAEEGNFELEKGSPCIGNGNIVTMEKYGIGCADIGAFCK